MAKRNPKQMELFPDLEKIQNSLGEAMLGGQGIGGGINNLGFPGNQGSPWSNPLSQSSPLFTNLRWYLVSNFRQVLSELYVEIGLVQTIVDVPVDDGLRGGITLKSKQLDEAQIEELQISLDRDDDINTAGQACKWNRLFGGAGILILTDQDPEEPLDISAITKDDKLEFRACDMWELFWDRQSTEGYDPTIQSEDFEHYIYYSEPIHKSRVMRLKGLTPPSFIRPRLRGWGFSVVEILVRSINQYLKATDLGYEVLDEFKLDIYKIKNLVNTLMSPNGAQKVQQRMQTANLIKNYSNALVMDSEDDYDHKQISFAGLAEAMAGIRMQVASDMRMPITKLFGQSVSGGIGNNDQNDMENYNSMVESQVRNKLKYDILRICEIKCQYLFGFIPDDLTLDFAPLRELSAEQEENVKTQKFARLIQAKQTNEISTQEFRDACNKGDLFDVQLDTAEDALGQLDGEAQDIVAGDSAQSDEAKEGKDMPAKPVDVDDPGANRVDTAKPRAWDVGGGPEEPTVEDKHSPKKENEMISIMPKPYSVFEKTIRVLNSAEYDIAAYEAEGGDAWIDERRKPFFENPGNVDEALWAKAKKASMKSYGKENWKFITYMYKKLGGKFT